MNPPSNLSIDGEVVKVRLLKSLGALPQGYAVAGDYADRVIRIAKGNTRRGQRISLLHEFLHYALERSAVKIPLKTEEAVCTAIDAWLFHLLAENPDLIAWLREEWT